MRKLIFVFLVCCLISSCVKKYDVITFDESEPFAIHPETQWALIIDPYVACRSEAAYESAVNDYFRRGDIKIIKGIRSVKGEDGYENWVSFEEGWVPQSSLKIYSNRLRAQSALKTLN